MRDLNRIKRDFAGHHKGDKQDKSGDTDGDHRPSGTPFCGVDDGIAGAGRMESGVTEVVFCHPELRNTNQHAHTGSGKAPMPTIVRALAQTTANKRAEEGANINTHIEDAETAIASRITLRVQLTNNSTDVGFQKTGAGDNQQQANKKCLRRRNGQYEVATHNYNAAEEYSALCAQQAIGNPAAGQCDDIDQRRINAVNCRR